MVQWIKPRYHWLWIWNYIPSEHIPPHSVLATNKLRPGTNADWGNLLLQFLRYTALRFRVWYQLSLPNLTSALSVSSTFCPLMSLCITWFWWRWLTPYNKWNITHIVDNDQSAPIQTDLPVTVLLIKGKLNKKTYIEHFMANVWNPLLFQCFSFWSCKIKGKSIISQ